MKKKALIALLAALTAGSFLLLSGCGTDQTDISGSSISAEAETEHLSEGTVQMHSVWYNTDNSALAAAAITILDGREELFSGTTDEAGNLEACNLPGNTELTFQVTDSTGDTLAEGEVTFKISEDYESLTIYPVHDEDNSGHLLEISPDKTVLRAAIFITEDGDISFANLSPYNESSDGTDNTGEADTTGGTADQGQDGAAADQAGQAVTDQGQAATDQGQAATDQGQAATDQGQAAPQQ